MKGSTLWQVSVSVPAEAEESVLALLGSHLASRASSYRLANADRATVSVYLPTPPGVARLGRLRQAFSGIRHSANATAQPTRKNSAVSGGRLRGSTPLDTLDGLARELVHVPQLRPGARWGRIRVRRVRHENWAESWKRHFKPLLIGRRLLLKPSWCRRRARAGQRVVILDPGLSFGTGHHPTTGFCLRQVVAIRENEGADSFLDLGTGSGILAIAAAKLGYRRIDAMDHDPAAIRVARENARRNRVESRIGLRVQDLRRLPLRAAEAYDLVCANLTSDLLIEHRRRVAARVRPGGALVLAGILRGEFDSVAAAYAGLGLLPVNRSAEREWTSGRFVRRT
jgi:ribosomal protein L11 methyltransferase